MNSNQDLAKQGMRISDNTVSSEQALLWHTWREKSRRVDLLAEKRMTVLFLAVGLVLLAAVCHYAFRAKASFDPNQQHPAAIYEYSLTPLVGFHGQHGRNVRAMEHAKSPTTARRDPEIELHIVRRKVGTPGALI
jgi:hypothetical protein